MLSRLLIHIWYQEEEEERSQKWKNFIEHQEASQPNSPEKKHKESLRAEATKLNDETVPWKSKGNKAETTDQNDTTAPEVDNQGNKAEATKLIEDTISRSGNEVEKGEDNKLKEENFPEK